MEPETPPVIPPAPPVEIPQTPPVSTIRGQIGRPAEDTPADAVVPRTVFIERGFPGQPQQLCAQFIFTGVEADAVELLAVLTKVSKVNGVRIVVAGGW